MLVARPDSHVLDHLVGLPEAGFGRRASGGVTGVAGAVKFSGTRRAQYFSEDLEIQAHGRWKYRPMAARQDRECYYYGARPGEAIGNAYVSAAPAHRRLRVGAMVEVCKLKVTAARAQSFAWARHIAEEARSSLTVWRQSRAQQWQA